MKLIGEQTYYEVLEVSPTATTKEIQMAYGHAKETFHSDSLAVYSLFSEEEINEIQKAIEEANANRWGTPIDMPNGKRLSADAIIEGLHLESFLEEEEG